MGRAIMRWTAALLVVVAACGDDGSSELDAATLGAAPLADAAVADAATVDGPPADAATGDAGPLPGFGTISGACGVISTADLTSATPLSVEAALEFATAYSAEHLGELSAGGQEIVADGNLGGSSLMSEVFAYELLYRCELATLLKTEAEIVYQNTGGKKTDLLVEMDSLKIGVSVVRAYAYPGTTPITVPGATTLLTGKLNDIKLSSANVSTADAWEKQILSVLAYGPEDAVNVATAYAALPADVKGDTIVVITRTDGADAPIYQ